MLSANELRKNTSTNHLLDVDPRRHREEKAVKREQKIRCIKLVHRKQLLDIIFV